MKIIGTFTAFAALLAGGAALVLLILLGLRQAWRLTGAPGFATRTTALGWKLSGAGGGGYLTLFSEQPITGALRVKIRRRHSGL